MLTHRHSGDDLRSQRCAQTAATATVTSSPPASASADDDDATDDDDVLLPNQLPSTIKRPDDGPTGNH